MTMQLDSTGLTIDTQDEIKADIETRQRANISDRLDVSTTSPHGQHNAIVSRALRLVQEAVAAIYLAFDPDGATGDALDRLCAITGITREPASKTRSTVVVNVDPGTYVAGSLVAQVTGRPDDTFTNIADVVNGGGSPTDVSAIFDATNTGAVQCPSNTLVIAGPVSGWNSITSNTEGEIGSEIETDAQLRLRREQAIANPGSTSAAGIAADILSNITAVDSVTVVENDTGATVDSIPAHSIEAIVFGPASPSAEDNLEVATQILASKAAGIGTYGNTAVNVTDSQNQTHAINLTRPTISDLTIVIALDYDTNFYAGDTELKEAIAAAATLAFVPGLDASGSQIAAWAHDVAGVLRVTSVTINAGASFAVHAIDSRTLARIQTSNITVTSTAATP